VGCARAQDGRRPCLAIVGIGRVVLGKVIAEKRPGRYGVATALNNRNIPVGRRGGTEADSAAA
jgi:hypothetical protein